MRAHLALALLFAGLPSAQAVAPRPIPTADPALSPTFGNTDVLPLSDGVNPLHFRGGLCGNNYQQTIGWQFFVVEPVTVIRMAWFDEDQDGLEIPHEVGIWDPDGNLIATTNVTIPVGTAAPLDGVWRLVPIPPTPLTPGNTYIVGGYNGTHAECLNGDVQQIVHPDLFYLGATFAQVNFVFERPTSPSIAFNGFYGVGFQVLERSLGLTSTSANGEVRTFTVIGAEPGQPVWLLAGTSVPRAASPSRAPVEGARLVGQAVADELGRATLRVRVPRSVRTAGPLFQAFEPAEWRFSAPER